MNNIRFDVEVLNGNTDYLYRFKNPLGDDGVLLNEFVHRMIINNYIKCFVPYTYEIQDGHRSLRYSISPHPVLSDYLKNTFTDISACADVIVNILKAIKTAEEYMIDRRFLLLNADYMFINKSDHSVTLMCVPVNTAENGSLSEFMRSIIMPLNFEGLANSDTLKVTVYQYAFDNETTDDAIAYFSDFCSKVEKAPAPAPQPVQPVHPPVVQEPVPVQPQNNGIFGSILKKDPPKPAAPVNPVKPAAPIPPTAPATPVKPAAPVNPMGNGMNVPPPKPVNDNKSEKKGLFDGLFGGKDKKPKTPPAAPQPAPAANPFGVNMPGANNAPQAQPPKAGIPVPPAPQPPSFPGINLPGKKIDIAKPAPQEPVPAASSVAPMKVEDEEDTVFETQDEGTVFLTESFHRALLRDNTGASFDIMGNIFTIGRTGKNSVKIDLDLPQKTVSHLHATIYHENGQYFVSDNNSANGTFLNNKRLAPNERVELTHGARLRISNIDFTFELL